MLSEALRTRGFRPDPYRYFQLHRPKTRTVSEASFRDRVVHHALVGALEPVFEAAFVPTSYACRKGRGQHAAMRRLQRLTRRHRYALRMDISRYFDHIDHGILLGLLARKVRGEGILWLCRTLMEGACVPTVPPGSGRGLPIGNLTSQFWANVYLDPLDQHVFRTLGQQTWTRYMDDMVVLGNDKARLWSIHAEVRRFVDDTLGLPLKDKATVLAPVSEGVAWLGCRVFPGLVRLDRASRRRFARKLSGSMARVRSGEVTEEAEVPRLASLIGHAAHADTLMLRRSLLARLDPDLPSG